MMAFFLLMWLLGSTTKGDLKGIAEYFQTPLKVAMLGGSGSGDSSSIQGRRPGPDAQERPGEEGRRDPQDQEDLRPERPPRPQMASKEERQRLKLKAKIEAMIEANPTLKLFKKQLLLDITTEGLRIQIVDEQNRPMFALAKADLQPYTREILHEIGIVLNDVPNRIGLSGHTDSTPIERRQGLQQLGAVGRPRQRLAARADRRRHGGRARCCAWWAWRRPRTSTARSDPFNPINRRISIIVMNKRTEEAIMRDNAMLEVRQHAVGAGKPACGRRGAGPEIRNDKKKDLLSRTSSA
jgi:chemotaxis protein MotB